MLFQLVSRRYQNKSTLITTNRAFGEWNEVFPDAAYVVSLVDRLMHNAEIVDGPPTATPVLLFAPLTDANRKSWLAVPTGLRFPVTYSPRPKLQNPLRALL
jgi:hypothetical protein